MHDIKMKLMEFALGSQRKRMLKKNSRWKKSNLIISGVKIHVFKENQRQHVSQNGPINLKSTKVTILAF